MQEINFKKWIIEESISGLVPIIQRAVAETAQNTYNRLQGRKGIGLCSYIAENIVKNLKPLLQTHGFQVTEYWGPGGFNPMKGRDHVSNAIYNPTTRQAFEIDIPENKYQIRKQKTYGFRILDNVIFSPQDVNITPINFDEFAE